MTKHYPLHHEDAGPLYKKIAVDEYNRLRDENAELREKVASLEEAQRWRKFSEEKPDNGQEVLVWLTAGGPHGFVLTSTYIDSQWYYGEDPQGCKPSHWMPLPSEPNEEK